MDPLEESAYIVYTEQKYKTQIRISLFTWNMRGFYTVSTEAYAKPKLTQHNKTTYICFPEYPFLFFKHFKFKNIL